MSSGEATYIRAPVVGGPLDGRTMVVSSVQDFRFVKLQTREPYGSWVEYILRDGKLVVMK